VMVLVFSGRSNESDRVRDEVVMAADEGKPILPFRVEDAAPPGPVDIRAVGPPQRPC